MNDDAGTKDGKLKSEDKEIEIDEETKEIIENFFKKIEKDKDRLYFICTKGIGDFIITGGFSQAVQQRKNKKSTVLVIKKQKRDSGIFFPNFSDSIAFDEGILDAFEEYFARTKKYEGDNYIYANFHQKNGKPIWDENFTILDRLKINALNLPLDTPFVYPMVEEIPEEKVAALYEKYVLDPKRTIILLPHCITFQKALSKEFWVKMARRLKEKNYIVYTNVAGKEKPIEGTEPFKVNFSELYHLTDKVKCFIGINSGIFIFLAMTDARMINVNPFPQWFWDISVMFPDCLNHTFYDTTTALETLKESLDKYEITAKIHYSHEIIPQEDIFYSTDDILESILKEVEQMQP